MVKAGLLAWVAVLAALDPAHALHVAGAGVRPDLGHGSKLGVRGALVSATAKDCGGPLRLQGGGGGREVNPFAQLRGLSPMQQNAFGVFAICVFVFGSVEACGKITDLELVPRTLSRKLTHISVGASMLSLLALFPIGHSTPGRLAISLFLCGFMMGFALAAYIPDSELDMLPGFLRKRVQRLAGLCRGGERRELMGGTFFYCAMIANMVCLHWTAPVCVISLSALILGDGFADPVGRVLGQRASVQYQVAWFGKKSIPGSLACFLATLGGAGAWGALFEWAGHYGPNFDFGSYMKAACWCAAGATIAEAVSPPHVDNLLVVLASNLVCYYLSSAWKKPFLLETLG